MGLPVMAGLDLLMTIGTVPSLTPGTELRQCKIESYYFKLISCFAQRIFVRPPYSWDLTKFDVMHHGLGAPKLVCDATQLAVEVTVHGK
jgi:hypothetical protein